VGGSDARRVPDALPHISSLFNLDGLRAVTALNVRRLSFSLLIFESDFRYRYLLNFWYIFFIDVYLCFGVCLVVLVCLDICFEALLCWSNLFCCNLICALY